MRLSRPGLCLSAMCLSLLAAASFSQSAPAAATGADTGAPALTVLDVSERNVEGKNQLCALFSQPLAGSQDIQPYFNVSKKDEGLVDGAWVLSAQDKRACFPNTEPRTEYRLTIYRNLPAANGRTLKSNHVGTLTTRRLTPVVSFDTRGSVLSADVSDGLPLVTVNVDQVDLNFHRVKPRFLGQLFRDLRHGNKWNVLQQLKDSADLVYSGRFDLFPPDNTRSKRTLDLKPIAQLREPGVYVAVMNQAGSYNDSEKFTYFTVTDLGLHARFYPRRLDVFVSSIKTATAVAGAQLSLYRRDGKLLRQTRTSPEGLASFVAPPDDANYLIANRGREQTVLELRGPALDLSDFDLGSHLFHKQEMFLYSERDLYRPGETARFSGLLRNFDGRLEAGPVLDARLLGPDNRVHNTFKWSGNPQAYYYREFAIPAQAKTGTWQLAVKKPDGKDAIYRFKVEEFLPERMKLTLNDGQTRSVSDIGQELSLPILGEYLYGAPASGNRLDALVNVSHWRQPIEELQDYSFGDERDTAGIQQFELSDLKLDGDGRASLKVGNRWREAKSPLRIKVVASLYESGGRPVSRAHSHLVWPAESLMGIRPEWADDENPRANSRASFDIVRANRHGEKLAAQAVEVTLIREDRQYFWEFSTGRGWHYEYTDKEYPLLTKTVKLELGQSAKVQMAVEWGRYRLETVDPISGLKTSLRFSAGHDWYRRWQRNRQGEQSARPDQVALALDRKAYRPGDTVQLHILPPHAGEALILVESDQPLWTRRLTVGKDGATVAIPVGEQWQRHDIYISAVVLRPASESREHTPSRAFGLVHLPLDRSDRTLTVRLTAPERTEPNLPLMTAVTVTPKSGASADLPEQIFITLAAVDVGVLSITDFETPDPVKGFFQRRRYNIDSRDMYDHLIESGDNELARMKFGGDALTSGGKEPMSQARIVSLFSGPVRLDGDGNARISLDLPDFNGRLRLMALAFGENTFGSGEHEVTVAAPLVTQLAMPRFLAGGDESSLALDLHNLSGQHQDFTIALDSGDLLTLKGESQRTLSLRDEEKRTVRFELRAGHRFGQARIRLSVRGESLRDFQRLWTLGVRPAVPAETRVQRFVLDGERASHSLHPPNLRQWHPQTVESTLHIDDQVDLDLRRNLRYLLRYPYGCLEQTTSSAYPWVYADEANIQRFGLGKSDLPDRRDSIEHALERLQARQRAEGGFGLWSNASPEEHWLGAYVADFLLNAAARGLPGNQAMLDKILRRLQTYLRHDAMFFKRYSRDPDHYRFAYRSYAAYVLSRVRRANLSALRNLYDRHQGDAKTPLPLIHLGLALIKMGDRRRGQQAIDAALSRSFKYDVYLGDYGSSIRDDAQMIFLLLKHGVATQRALLRSLELERKVRARTHLSTQERNALFLAGIALDSHSSQAWGLELKIGDVAKTFKQTGGMNTSLSAEQLQSGVSVRRLTPAPLFGSFETRGYPLAAPAPVSQGIRITRGYFDREGNPVQLSRLEVGDLVIAHLTVTSENRHQDTLVVDLLPAGLELENQNLNHAVDLDEFKIDGKGLAELQRGTKIQHQEYRDDRFVAALDLGYRGHRSHLFYLARAVTPGEYSVPPPMVEDMYRPEIRAVGETPGKLIVTHGAEEPAAKTRTDAKAQSAIRAVD